MTNRQSLHLRPDLERHFSFAQAVRSGDLLFVSGSVAMDAAGAPLGGDMASQVHAIYASLTEFLAGQGFDAGQVVKETIYTVDMDALVAAAPVRAAFYADRAPPAATWVEVRRLLTADYLLEVELTLMADGASRA
ncbi:Endoribonuclease L-PSP [Rhizorhabdus wittichii RW1]|jgi:enamine deaminase RidA (YjgF/YER057c/UK114 family)|uniref:Endoribonuclease L-PSP n=1 Tax=Rhizorhabdus wittichii (strain DSM 6014 / CCUG 31198 / JCM 15750 / NBRC 105917 / EY 4224 / RW1) TaxID=392499 RepID=A0A9J9LDK0_RHIWR|nr:Endoribonuclease L-PSP [Rhizorhabdus wittichii RW1]